MTTKPTWRDVTDYRHPRAEYGQPLAFEIDAAGVTIEVRHYLYAASGRGWYASCRGGLTVEATLLPGIPWGHTRRARVAAADVVLRRLQTMAAAVRSVQ